jgi:hypothetical protein
MVTGKRGKKRQITSSASNLEALYSFLFQWKNGDYKMNTK